MPIIFEKDGAYGEPGPVLIFNFSRSQIAGLANNLMDKDSNYEGRCDNMYDLFFRIQKADYCDISIVGNLLLISINGNKCKEIFKKLEHVEMENYSFNYFDIDNCDNIEVVVRNVSH